MSKYKEFVELIDEMSKITIDSLRQFESLQKEKFAILDTVAADLEQRKQTGILTCSLGNNTIEDTTEPTTEPVQRGRTKQKTHASGRSSSLKENPTEPYAGRPRATGQRKAFMEASQAINNYSSAINGSAPLVKVERCTDEFFKKHPEMVNIPMKQEKTDMLPPTKPPVRQTRKKKGTQTTGADSDSVLVKEELIDMESKKRKASAKPATAEKPSITARDSDVQITPEPIDMVNLVESDEDDMEGSAIPRARPKTKRRLQKKQTNSSTDEGKTETEVATRVTRTKTRNAAKNKEAGIEQEATIEKQKRVHSSSTEDDDKEKKPTKRTKAKKLVRNKKKEESSVYEDALSDAEKIQNKMETETEQTSKNNEAESRTPHIMNETIVLTKPTALHETVIVEKPKNPAVMNETIVVSKLPNGNQQLMDHLLTDDEDIVPSPVRIQKTKKIKQVFSPYENSPVKKRVEAFEKLGAEGNCDLPPRMTRTKTKAKAQAAEENGHAEHEAVPENISYAVKNTVIPKLRNTPLHQGTVPKCNTPLHQGAIPKLKTSQAAQFSGLKASHAEFRERELRRQQKEADALAKKEALIQAQTEERRRKREERQLKAQHMREVLENDKQKILELAERQKQEKMKQMKAEKEEKLLKQREEAARKRAQAMKKATEEKYRAEEERKRLEHKKRQKEAMHEKEAAGQTPPYLKYETPLLPTLDCYDSDDSNASKPFTEPHWQKREALAKVLTCMRYIDIQKRLLFCNRPKTVDLKEIFPSIEPHKLKRTSSAIWNKSGLALLPSTVEEDEDNMA